MFFSYIFMTIWDTPNLWHVHSWRETIQEKVHAGMFYEEHSLQYFHNPFPEVIHSCFYWQKSQDSVFYNQFLSASVLCDFKLNTSYHTCLPVKVNIFCQSWTIYDIHISMFDLSIVNL